jgi:hypothetical protein
LRVSEFFKLRVEPQCHVSKFNRKTNKQGDQNGDFSPLVTYKSTQRTQRSGVCQRKSFTAPNLHAHVL